MKKYKYIHLLWGNDVKFSRPLVNMINSTPGSFNPSDHLFITPFEDVEEKLSSYKNVVLDKSAKDARIINKYADDCEWIISHGLPGAPFMVKRKYFNKIVWRTWGGSRQRTQWDYRHLLSSIKGVIGDFIYNLYYKYSYGCSRVIGVANIVDIIDLEQWTWAKNTKLFPLSYSDSSYDDIINNIIIKQKGTNSHYVFLVGHQGDPGEHHLDIIHRLLDYNKDNIKIIVPLSYGNSMYIALLKKQIESLNDKRICVLDKLLPINDYIQLLANVDIAIIDEKSSMALGNISFLLRFQKKIYINKDSVIRKAFDHEGLPYSLTKEIGVSTFEEIVRSLSYPQNMSSELIFQQYPVRVKKNVTFFSYLDKISKNG